MTQISGFGIASPNSKSLFIDVAARVDIEDFDRVLCPKEENPEFSDSQAIQVLDGSTAHFLDIARIGQYINCGYDARSNILLEF
jgi:hypothetical protein